MHTDEGPEGVLIGKYGMCYLQVYASEGFFREFDKPSACMTLARALAVGVSICSSTGGDFNHDEVAIIVVDDTHATHIVAPCREKDGVEDFLRDVTGLGR